MGVRVREKPKGSGEWYIFISHKGKRRAKKVGRDEKIARRLAEKVKAKLVLNELDVEKINKKSPTFKEYAETWLRLPHDRKDSTQSIYKAQFKLHIYPAIGGLRLDSIRRRDMKLFSDALLVKGINPKNVLAPLRHIFNHAVESEVIEHSPLNGMKFTKPKTKQTFDPLTEQETVLLLDEMEKYRDGAFYPHALCLLRTGLRIGELMALTWSDIDFENRLMTISKSMDRTGKTTTPKNRKSRKVDMSKQLTEVLRDLKGKEWKEAAKNNRPTLQHVFPGNGKRVPGLNAFRNALRDCLKGAGLRHVRIHDLRHSYATIRLLRGHNIGDVAFQLGHSDVSITYRVYAHWIPGKFKSQVDELDDVQPTTTYVQPEKMAGTNN
jgi:integrase